MQDDAKELDYHGLLIAHLNRLSYVCTSNFIDVMNPALAEKYENPPTTGERALQWGVLYLYAIVPDGLRDDTFNKEVIASEIQGSQYNLLMLKKMINLLHRKGLLIQSKTIGRREKRDLPDDAIQQVWED